MAKVHQEYVVDAQENPRAVLLPVEE